MSVWEKYTKEQQDEYKKFLQVYGSLSNLFRQKHGEPIPYLDSKFQETIYARVFSSENVDIGNTPHDILSVFGSERIGIGLKTWMNSTPSYQKVMQLKRYKDDIMAQEHNPYDMVYVISSIKNERMKSDYNRLGLDENSNIYHYITRDAGSLVIQECTYPLIELDKITNVNRTDSSITWTDGVKNYKFTFGDSQIWQYFGDSRDSTILDKITVEIMEDPFTFLVKAYESLGPSSSEMGRKILSKAFMSSGNDTIAFPLDKDASDNIVECFLPLYSFRSKEVEQKSGLNAWNAAPKNPLNPTPRPLNEVYIPIPREFHNKYPDFFVKNIFEFEKMQSEYTGVKKFKPEIRFTLVLPNGREIPALVTQDQHKGLQSGSLYEIDPNTGKLFGQSALGQWLLVDVLGLDERILVTREWLAKKGIDSVRLWHKKGDYRRIYIDVAPYNSFENFMNGIVVDYTEE
ncbi:MAG: NgoFVII family restriction endonuclease [Veillonella sp.]|uniref:restriction endonuclease PLD domain-containing protein n=1 Tax=Veillonella sp. TaxID=1926307 RepID=UPI002912A9A4|nr:restriction endonuclease PLD domain-containing protein [Veillonella sp.]MDU5763181.1 NgoFVII family restriction endonuclease [Veillonella sp.]MDU6398611.1 NgoFVII family restriction endonuclease [Veillonella sp.]